MRFTFGTKYVVFKRLAGFGYDWGGYIATSCRSGDVQPVQRQKRIFFPASLAVVPSVGGGGVVRPSFSEVLKSRISFDVRASTIAWQSLRHSERSVACDRDCISNLSIDTWSSSRYLFLGRPLVAS